MLTKLLLQKKIHCESAYFTNFNDFFYQKFCEVEGYNIIILFQFVQNRNKNTLINLYFYSFLNTITYYI